HGDLVRATDQPPMAYTAFLELGFDLSVRVRGAEVEVPPGIGPNPGILEHHGLRRADGGASVVADRLDVDVVEASGRVEARVEFDVHAHAAADAELSKTRVPRVMLQESHDGVLEDALRGKGDVLVPFVDRF